MTRLAKKVKLLCGQLDKHRADECLLEVKVCKLVVANEFQLLHDFRNILLRSDLDVAQEAIRTLFDETFGPYVALGVQLHVSNTAYIA